MLEVKEFLKELLKNERKEAIKTRLDGFSINGIQEE